MKVASDAPSRAPVPSDAEVASRSRNLIAAALVAVIAAGVVMRFVTRSDLWLDEALTANIANLPLGDLEEALRHDGAPPLYYVLLHFWTDMFGEGDMATRAMSGLFGVAALVPMYFVGRRIGGQFVGWAAVILLATSPYAIRYSTENRPYSLQILLVLLGWLALARALERPSLPRLALVAVVTGLLLYCQYWSIYLLAVVGVVLLWRAFKADTTDERWAARSGIVAIVAGGLTFLPWVPTFLYQAEHTGTPWGERILPPAGFAYTAIAFTGGRDHSEAYVLLVPLLVLALLALFGRALDARRVELDLRTRPGVRLEAVILVTALLLGLLASYAAGTTHDGRYAAIVFPLFIAVVAVGLMVFADVRVRTGALVFVAILGLGGGVRNVVENRTQAAQVADVIKEEAKPGDVVVYCPDQVGPDVSRLLRDVEGLEHFTFPDAAPPEFVDWVDYQERIDRADPTAFAAEMVEQTGDNTLWFVVAPGYRNFEGECEAVGAALGAGRPGATTRVEPDNQFFEFQGLIEYPAP